MEEIYKIIEGFENYQISNFGNVKRNENVLKKTVYKNGYIYVSLSNIGKVKKRTIHSLVAEMFLNHKSDGTNKIVIDHIDNDKQNNNICNLQLITNRQNCSKEKKGITSIFVGVRKNKGKYETQIRINGKREYLGRFVTELEAHNAYQNRLNEFNTRTKGT